MKTTTIGFADMVALLEIHPPLNRNEDRESNFVDWEDELRSPHGILTPNDSFISFEMMERAFGGAFDRK